MWDIDDIDGIAIFPLFAYTSVFDGVAVYEKHWHCFIADKVKCQEAVVTRAFRE